MSSRSRSFLERHVDAVVRALYIVCGLLFLVEPWIERHPHFGFEGWIGFYGVFGFVAFVALVQLAKGWRKVVRRDEDYYE